MPPKKKKINNMINPKLPPTVDPNHISLADKYYKIIKTKYDFDLFKVYYWLEDNHLDQIDEIKIWETNLPLYTFPQTYHFPEFIQKFQAWYLPN